MDRMTSESHHCFICLFLVAPIMNPIAELLRGNAGTMCMFSDNVRLGLRCLPFELICFHTFDRYIRTQQFEASTEKEMRKSRLLQIHAFSISSEVIDQS